MQPYVLSLVYARAYTFEIRRRNHPQGGQGGLQAPARRFVAARVLRLGRIFDAQSSGFCHKHHPSNILTRAHNLGDDLCRALFPRPTIARQLVLKIAEFCEVFVRLALFVWFGQYT